MPKALKSTSLRVDIRYLLDGAMEYEILEPDTRKSPEAVRRKQKWRKRGSGICSTTPSWHELHEIGAVLVKRDMRLPSPLDYLMKIMQYDVHCLDVERRKQAKLKAPG